MVMVAQDLFPKGSWKGQKKDGFYMDPILKQQLDYYLQNVEDDWDFTIIISAGGSVRQGKTLLPSSDIKVYENGKVVNRKLSEFEDGDIIKTISWDFEKGEEVVSESEVIVETERKDLYEVALENGKKIYCSMDHKLFVKRVLRSKKEGLKEYIFEEKLKDLKEGDEIVCLI